MPPLPFTNIQFGDGLAVTDLGSESIRVDLDVTSGGGGGSGIQFDTYPQDGNWLFVETTDSSGAGGAPHGRGLELKDTSTGGILIESWNGDVTIESDVGTLNLWADSDNIFMSANTNIDILADEGVNIQANDSMSIGADNTIIISAALAGADGEILKLDINGGGALTLRDDGTTSLTADTLLSFGLGTFGGSAGDLAMHLAAAGSTVTVYDSGNNPIFRVDEDGDVHIKTGKTVTADL